MTQRLGKYQLGELLGQGGMGAVYRSFHPQLNRPVAIKVIQGNSAADVQAHQRFMREAQVVAGLSHPQIINIFDVDVQNGQPYIVMEFVAGGSLAARLAAGPLAPGEAIRLMIPLAEALDYAHRQGLVHRDLKPANVLLRPDGSPVLADFGLARAAQPVTSARITASGMLLGTLAYMAPEQFTGAALDARTDIYALGVMFFEMLTGRPPFEGDSAQIMYGHLQQAPPTPRALAPDLPVEVERLALRMLAKDPAARPQSAAEVAAALRAIGSGEAMTGPTIALAAPVAPTVAVGAPLAEQTAPEQPRARLGPALGVAALLLVIGAAVLVALRIASFGGGPQIGSGIAPTRPAGAGEFATSLPATARPTPLGAGGRELATPASRPTPAPTTAGKGLEAAELERVGDAQLTKVAFEGPERFSVGNLSVAKIGKGLWFFGEVRNDGDESRESVEVRVNLRDAQGKEVASQAGQAHLSYLKPGEISSFSVLFSGDEALPEYKDYAIEVRSSKADFQPGYTIRELRVGGDVRVSRDSLNFLNLSGKVYNEGAQPAKYVHLYVVFYDTAGAVVGVSDTFAITGDDKIVAAGAEAEFRLQAVIFTGEPARYRVFAQGSKAD